MCILKIGIFRWQARGFLVAAYLDQTPDTATCRDFKVSQAIKWASLLEFWVTLRFWEIENILDHFCRKVWSCQKKPNWWRCEPGSGEICKLTMDRLAPILALFCVSARIFPLINWRFHSALPVELLASAYFVLNPNTSSFLRNSREVSFIDLPVFCCCKY